MVPAGRVPLADLLDPLAKMGQVLFNPPNVKGWRTGTDWLNSATLLARNNFAEKVALGTWNLNARPPQNNERFFAATSTDVPDTKPTESPTPPPPDAARHDVWTLIAAEKPKDVAAVVKRIGELLYGEAVTPLHAKKIEQFLLTPGPSTPAKPPAPKNAPRGPGGAPPLPEPPSPKVDASAPPAPKGKGKPEAKKDAPPKPLDPKDVKIDSPEFKARAREAVHAMMCLPEYQLN